MSTTTLPEFCFDVMSRGLNLERVAGFEDVEQVKLLNGEEGGGIKIYTGEGGVKVTLVDFKLGEGVPVPHHDNRLCVGAELFLVSHDLSRKVPTWGINNIIMKDGMYYFDCDFSFGFDLVMEYDYMQKYIAPFNDTYQKFAKHPDFTPVTFYESTPWVRTYISPLFLSAITTTDKAETVFEFAEACIQQWLAMFRGEGKVDAAFQQSQQKRLQARNAGSKDSDRMGKVLFGAYGKETFAKFFKAMTG